MADTVAFDSKELYDYVAGDLTNAYRRETKDLSLVHYDSTRRTFTPKPAKNKLTRCTRQIVFLKPDVFVIYDRVDSTSSNFTISMPGQTASIGPRRMDRFTAGSIRRCGVSRRNPP